MHRYQQRDNGGNVLLVTDDSATTRGVLEVLARRGIRGHVARDKEAAMEFLDRDQCDLVMLSTNTVKRCSGRASGSASSAATETSFQLLDSIKGIGPELPVIMIGESPGAAIGADETDNFAPDQMACGCVATAVRAIQTGGSRSDRADRGHVPALPQHIDGGGGPGRYAVSLSDCRQQSETN